MADGSATFRAGEKAPVYGQVTLSSGTLTITGTPTCTLYDATGAAVAGWPKNATGFDGGALANPRVWMDLDTTTLAAGWYTLAFSFTATGSDGMARLYEPEIDVLVQAVP